MILIDDANPYVAFTNASPFGGLKTKTAHIFYSLGLQNKKVVYSYANSPRVENFIREYGYGLAKRNIPFALLNYFPKDAKIFLAELHWDLINGTNEDELLRLKDVTYSLTNTKFRLPAKFFDKVRDKWKFVAIRRTIANFYKKEHNLNVETIPHIWYSYPTSTVKQKKGAIACCRLDYPKKIEMIFDANDLLVAYHSSPKEHENICYVHGAKMSGVYMYHILKEERLKKYYKGSFKKSWDAISRIQSPAKFGINLSDFPEDGGGTENTTLEYIYHNVAVILHRNWIKKGKQFAGESEFEEGYNCFAVENKTELAELLRRNPDTDNIIKNARKILDNHTGNKLEEKWRRVIGN